MFPFRTLSRAGFNQTAHRLCVRTFFGILNAGFVFGAALYAHSAAWAEHPRLSLLETAADPCRAALQGPAITTHYQGATPVETVFVAGSQEGRHGLVNYILDRSHGPWLSNIAKFSFAPQGDPRWFVGAFGEEVARFFDFEIRDARTMIIPSTSAFRAAVEKVNAVLARRHQQQIGLDFDDGDITAKPLSMYLDKFVGNPMTLQFAAEGAHLIHDISFHSGAIILPNELLRIARDRIHFIRNFFEFALNTTAQINPELQQRLKDIKKYLSFFLVRGIDNGTAFSNLFMIADRAEDLFVIGDLQNLMAVRNDIPSDSIPKIGFGILIASHMILGAVRTISEPRDSDYDFTFPRDIRSISKLQNYALYLLKHCLKVHISKNSRGVSNVAIGRKIRDMEEMLDLMMFDFAKTNDGRLAQFDLFRALSPYRGFKQTETGFGFSKEDADYWSEKLRTKQRNIISAVKSLL